MWKLILVLLFPLYLKAQVWTPEMDSLARVTEAKYKLPHGTCQAFALQESNYNQYAVRAEGNYITAGGKYAENIRREATQFSVTHEYQPSILTEIVQRGESWTLFQIMGQNLRNMGLSVPFFVQDLKLEDQFKYFGTFISNLLIKHNYKLDYAASEYNGGSKAVRDGDFTNKKYVSNILRNIEKFKY